MSAVFPITADARYRLLTASSNQTAFTIPYPFLESGDITAYKISLGGVRTLLTRPANYTLTGAGNPAGGTLTLKTGAAAGEKILIVGDATRARGNSVVRGGKYDSKAQDEDLDRLTLIAQEHDRDLARALLVDYGVDPPEVTPGADDTLALWHDGNLVEGPSAAALEAVEAALGVEAGRALVYPAAPADPKYDAHSRIIANVADGVAPGDAVNKSQLDDFGVDADRLDAIEARLDKLESSIRVDMILDDEAPEGWIILQGTTIGDAMSGATERADDDTESLFTKWWNKSDNTNFPLQDSSGAPVARGVSAAADFAAHRRLPMPDARGLVPRGLDLGRGYDPDRVLGTTQLDAIKAHLHLFTGTPRAPHAHTFSAQGRYGLNGATQSTFRPSEGDSTKGSSPTLTTSLAGGDTPAGTISSTGGTETRGKNIALLIIAML